MTQKGRMIAVVDDDPRVLESLEECLVSAGYETCSFSSAEALLDKDLLAIDVVITDGGMPGMNGLELNNRVKEARPELPAFLITGGHEIADQLRASGTSRFFHERRAEHSDQIACDRVCNARNPRERGCTWRDQKLNAPDRNTCTARHPASDRPYRRNLRCC